MRLILAYFNHALIVLGTLYFVAMLWRMGWWSLPFMALIGLAIYIMIRQQESESFKEAEKWHRNLLQRYYDRARKERREGDRLLAEDSFMEELWTYRRFCRDREREPGSKRRREKAIKRNREFWDSHPEYEKMKQDIEARRKAERQRRRASGQQAASAMPGNWG